MSYKYQYSSRLKLKSRNLRKNLTKTEQRLWNRIKSKQLGGYKFRRQFPIGNYVVDFYCVEKRLVIELDGGQHGEDHIKVKDEKRSKLLEKQGISVLRFWNNEVWKNLEGVLEVIFRELEKV